MMQVQIGTRLYTFDYIYGAKGSPPASMFKDCIAPLVDGLFQGYNGTVLAYGQVHEFMIGTYSLNCLLKMQSFYNLYVVDRIR